MLGGNEAIDLYHFGPAHTNGDTFVVFRALKVMHAGDVFPMKGTPFINRNNGGNGVTYPETIAKVAAGIKDVETVIPGHSAVTTWAAFVESGDFNKAFLTRHAGGEEGRQDRRAGRRRDQAAGEVQGLQRRPRQGERRSDLRGPALVFGDFRLPTARDRAWRRPVVGGRPWLIWLSLLSLAWRPCEGQHARGQDQLSRLVKQALDGEDVIIASNGEPMVRLVPVAGKGACADGAG